MGRRPERLRESPNRVFLLQRGELPNLSGRRTTASQLGPSMNPDRAPGVARRHVGGAPGNGGTGSSRREGITAWEKRGNKRASTHAGSQPSWCSTAPQDDRSGVEPVVIDDAAPHQIIIISPYESQKHVWIVDDHKPAITSSQRRQDQVQTSAPTACRRRPPRNFHRPAFMDFFPERAASPSPTSYNGYRVAWFDKDGKFVREWGKMRRERQGDAPGLLEQRARHRRRPEDEQVYVNDRGNRRIPVFRPQRQVPARMVGRRAPSDVHLIHWFDGAIWAADAAQQDGEVGHRRQLHVRLGQGATSPAAGGACTTSVSTRTATSTWPRSTTAAARSTVRARVRTRR